MPALPHSASHVVRLFVNSYPQYKIVNFDKLDYCASLKNIEDISKRPNYTFIKGDICSSDLVNYVLRTERVDTIMNFAAQTHVDNSFGNSFSFTETNILGTVRWLYSRRSPLYSPACENTHLQHYILRMIELAACGSRSLSLFSAARVVGGGEGSQDSFVSSRVNG